MHRLLPLLLAVLNWHLCLPMLLWTNGVMRDTRHLLSKRCCSFKEETRDKKGKDPDVSSYQWKWDDSRSLSALNTICTCYTISTISPFFHIPHRQTEAYLYNRSRQHYIICSVFSHRRNCIQIKRLYNTTACSVVLSFFLQHKREQIQVRKFINIWSKTQN